MARVVLLLLTALLLGACSTIATGTDDQVLVNTPGVQGADCTLDSPNQSLFVRTPGSVTLEKSSKNIAVVCKKAGYQDGTGTIVSTFEGWTVGNIIFGGLIGVGVDAASGAMHDYQPSINVQMVRLEGEDSELPPGSNTPVASASGVVKVKSGSRFVGDGVMACKRPWAVDMTVLGGRAKGQLWVEDVRYDFGGVLGIDESVFRAGKAKAFNGYAGPYFYTLRVSFEEDVAEGDVSVGSQPSLNCSTPVALFRADA